MVGQIVLTKFTNKTDRVDDINWEQNPTSKVKSSDGSEMSYVEYYKKHHNLDVKLVVLALRSCQKRITL